MSAAGGASVPVESDRPLVGQGLGCVVILEPTTVMTPADADKLALALIRAADRARLAATS